MIYYTLDADGERISQNATILTAESIDEVRAQVCGNDDDFELVEIVPGRFGDCWIRVFDATTLCQRRADWEREAGDLIIQAPGTHPGGKAYWITPSADVYVPIFKERA